MWVAASSRSTRGVRLSYRVPSASARVCVPSTSASIVAHTALPASGHSDQFISPWKASRMGSVLLARHKALSTFFRVSMARTVVPVTSLTSSNNVATGIAAAAVRAVGSGAWLNSGTADAAAARTWRTALSTPALAAMARGVVRCLHTQEAGDGPLTAQPRFAPIQSPRPRLLRFDQAVI